MFRGFGVRFGVLLAQDLGPFLHLLFPMLFSNFTPTPLSMEGQQEVKAANFFIIYF